MEQYYSFICLFWKFSPISNLVNVEITSHRYFNLFIGCLYLLELYLSYFCLFFIACMVLLLSTILICSFNIIHLEIFGPPIHFHWLFLKLTPYGGTVLSHMLELLSGTNSLKLFVIFPMYTS